MPYVKGKVKQSGPVYACMRWKSSCQRSKQRKNNKNNMDKKIPEKSKYFNYKIHGYFN